MESITLGQLRKMTAHLPDDTEIITHDAEATLREIDLILVYEGCNGETIVSLQLLPEEDLPNPDH